MLRLVLFNALVAAVYVASGRLGLLLAPPEHASATAVWPPTGISLAAMLLGGVWMWPGVFLGALLTNITHASAFLTNLGPLPVLGTSFGIAIGNTLEAVMGAFLVGHFAKGREAFLHGPRILLFAILVCSASTISATIGVANLHIAGVVTLRSFDDAWITWCLGNTTGAILITPAVVLGVAFPLRRWTIREVVELGLLFLSLAAAAYLIFSGRFPFPYPIIPILVWAGFRFGPFETSLAILVLSGFALWGTTSGTGPFVQESVHESLLFLQGFMGTIGLTAMCIAALVAERRAALRVFRDSQGVLEQRTRQQAQDLSQVVRALGDEVAERRQAEAAARQLASVVEASDDAVFSKSLDGIITSWNPGAKRTFGYDAEEIVGKSITLLLPGDRAKEYLADIQRIKAGEFIESFESERLRKDGRRIQVSLTLSPLRDDDGRIIGVGVIGRDITAKKRAEQMFKDLLEAAPDAMVIVNAPGDIVLVNAQTESLFGYRRDELLGKSVELLIPPRFRIAYMAHRDRYFSEPSVRPMGAGLQLFGLRKDGTEFPVEISLSPLKTEHGVLVLAAIRDITQRKQAEEILQASEQRLKLMIEHAYDAFVAIDTEGRIVEWNPQAEATFGWSRQEAVGRELATTIIPEEFREPHRQGLRRFRDTGEGRVLNRRLQFNALHRNGHVLPVELTISAIHWQTGYLFAAFVRDISGRLEMEEKLRQSERLAAIGEMVTGLAHESRNVLQRIQACLDLLSLKIQDKPDQIELVEDIQKAQDRLHHLYQEVRDYAAPIKLQKQPVDVHNLVTETWHELGPARQGRIVRLEHIYVRPLSAPTKPETQEFVAIQPGQMKSRNAAMASALSSSSADFTCNIDRLGIGQVFRNIFENALSAAADPVTIEVTWSQTEFNRRPALRISFHDNGPGLTAETRQRIFEPFFTTKVKGTGLGMAIARRIVEANGGEIFVGSSTKPGAEIVVVLGKDR